MHQIGRQNRSPMRLIFLIGITVVVGGGGFLVVRQWLRMNHNAAANRASADLVKRGMPVFDLSRGIARFQAETGHLPQSLEEVKTRLRDDLREYLEKDNQTSRDFRRTVLVRNIRTADGGTYNWMVMLLIPRFSMVPEDVICFAGEYRKDGQTQVEMPRRLGVAEARRLLGNAVVERAIHGNGDPDAVAPPASASASQPDAADQRESTILTSKAFPDGTIVQLARVAVTKHHPGRDARYPDLYWNYDLLLTEPGNEQPRVLWKFDAMIPVSDLPLDDPEVLALELQQNICAIAMNFRQMCEVIAFHRGADGKWLELPCLGDGPDGHLFGPKVDAAQFSFGEMTHVVLTRRGMTGGAQRVAPEPADEPTPSHLRSSIPD